MSTTREDDHASEHPTATPQVDIIGWTTLGEFERLYQPANAGDLAARTGLKRQLELHPEIWQRVGNLATHAEQNLVRLIAKENFLMTEALRRKAAELRQQFSEPSSASLEGPWP